MPIDYSKWDKLELSDDSDIEVHPNVDKNSFIRWKQRDIHEKRIERDNQIKGLRIQKEMYAHLNKRVDNMLATLTKSQLVDDSYRNKWADEHYDPSERCTLEENSDSPTYNEMVEDLFTQVKEDLTKEGKSPSDGDSVIAKIQEHRAKIENVLIQIDPKLDSLLAEKANHISSEDIHDGWNSSFVNKSSSTNATPAAAAAAPSTSSASTSVIETINTPTAQLNTPSKPLDQLDELEVLDETWEFSKIPIGSFAASARFLETHLYIVSTQQKDALLMKAFDSQLDEDYARAEQIVHQALILQFINDLFAAAGSKALPPQKIQAIGMFTSKLLDKNSPAFKTFDADFKKTYQHIVNRCKIISEEQSNEEQAEGVEQIQLRSMDPNSELVINIPQENTEEYKTFLKLPSAMQQAIKTESLDEINKVFATMTVEEAEGVLELFDECGVISIQALLEDEQQFEELKNQIEQEEREGGANRLEMLGEEDEEDNDVIVNKGEETSGFSTADMVD